MIEENAQWCGVESVLVTLNTQRVVFKNRVQRAVGR